MGLQKAIEFNNTGITLNYWRLNAVEVDIEANRTKVRIGGYTAKADALAGKKAVHNFFRDLSGNQNPIGLMTDPRDYQTLLYAKLSEPQVPLTPTNPLADATIVSDLPD
jgi:hypothetical protein